MGEVSGSCDGEQSLSELGISPRLLPPHVSVKSVVIPFKEIPRRRDFSWSRNALHWRSNGHLHTIRASVCQSANCSRSCTASERTDFSSRVSDIHKQEVVQVAQSLYRLGFELVATRGTAAAIKSAGVPAIVVNKVSEGRPNLVDRIKNGEIQLVINIPSGRTARDDDQLIRRASVNYNVPVVTTLAGARATASAIAAMQSGTISRPRVARLSPGHQQTRSIKHTRRHLGGNT